MWRGWSVNLSMPGLEHTFEASFPVPPLFESSQGSVLELVYWSHVCQRWIHGVSHHFQQNLPQGHVQLAVGDLEWLRHVSQGSEQGIAQCIYDLEARQHGYPC